MKLIVKIAKAELRNLFYSPVAWFVILVFFTICAFFYSTSIATLSNLQDSFSKSMPGWNGFPNSLTQVVFMRMTENGFMGNVLSNIYLFIPLLTMGLINREFNNGTVKLLYTSPVKLYKIVLGKYMAMMLFNLLLLTVVLVFMIIGAFSIVDIDWGHLTAGLIGFYLLVCAYTAIGLFMSSVSHYQIVSAIATFILLFAIQRVGTLWQEYDFVRELTFFLSIRGRTETIVQGLVTTKDVLYYLLIAALFLSFAYFRLLHERDKVSASKKVARYVGTFLLVITVGYLTSIPGYIGYWDATREDINTIQEPTQEILRTMQDGDLEVTLYSNLLGAGYAKSRPSARNQYIWGVWDRYIRFKPNIKFKYVNYYDTKDGDSTIFKRMPDMSLDSIAISYAKIFGDDLRKYLKPAEIRSQINLQPEGVRTVMLLKYKGDSIYLRTYDDAIFWPNESNFAAAFKRLSTGTSPKIYASTGSYERSIEKLGEREYAGYSTYKLSRKALINHGFDFDTINLQNRNVPPDATALVVADPKTEFSETVNKSLTTFIQNGGNVLFTGEPGKQHVLNPITQLLGVSLMPGSLVQVSEHETPDKITPYLTMDYTWLIAANTPFMEAVRRNLSNGDSVKIMSPGATHLEYQDKGFKYHRMWVTDPLSKIWLKSGPLVIDSAPPMMDVTKGDYILDSFNVAIALERNIENKHQKIAVVGDADFLSTQRSSSHFTGTDYLSWMAGEVFPIRLFDKQHKDALLRIGTAAGKAQKFILIWIVPGFIMAFGAILLFRRKRQ